MTRGRDDGIRCIFKPYSSSTTGNSSKACDLLDTTADSQYDIGPEYTCSAMLPSKLNATNKDAIDIVKVDAHSMGQSEESNLCRS